MEITENDGNPDVPVRRDVIQLGAEEELSASQEHVTEADSMLKSLSPLVNSMRAFGLYFTRVGPSPASCTSRLKRPRTGGCRSWNAARTYATVVLAMTWLNAARYHVNFVLDVHAGKPAVGADLFFKLGLVSTNVLTCVLFTAYYVASHTGSLDRVLRQADLSAADFPPMYSRRAKLVAIVCWTLVSWNMIYYIVTVCINGQYSGNDISLLLFIKTFRILKPYADIVKAVFIVLQLESLASWAFPQAMVTQLLCCSQSDAAYGTSNYRVSKFAPLSFVLHDNSRHTVAIVSSSNCLLYTSPSPRD